MLPDVKQLQIAQAPPLRRAFCNSVHPAPKPNACQTTSEFKKNGQAGAAIDGWFLPQSFSNLVSGKSAYLSQSLSYSARFGPPCTIAPSGLSGFRK
jgi:hypothetical protein